MGSITPVSNRLNRLSASAMRGVDVTVTTNRAIARADAIGLDALDKITGTSLDKGVELDALAKLPETERTVLIDRAAACDGLCWRAIGR